MAVRIQVRRDTFDNWRAANPVLASGEIGFISDRRQAKIGDGVTEWNALGFLVGGSEAEIIAKINQNTSAISTEANARSSGDAQLQSNINAEAAARAEGDNELSGRILALETADPDVPPDLVQQVETNTEAIQGLVTNDENLAEAINGKLGLPQGELTELNVNDWLIIGRTDPNTGTTPTYLSRLSTLKEEIGGGTDPEPEPEPEPTTVLNWNFAGETFFQAPPTGGIGLNPSGSTIYVSKTNAAGKNIETEFLNEFQPGNLFVMQVPARTNGDTGDSNQYMQFSISQAPVNQGNWWNVATQRIINANTTNPWEVGDSLDIVVQIAPQTRFLLTDPDEQPEDIITDPELLDHWEDFKGRQDWEEGYIPTQQDVNRYFNEIDQVQQAVIRNLSSRVEKLEIDTQPPADDSWATYTFAGADWWAQPESGELWTNFSENQINMSCIDANDVDMTVEIDKLSKGDHVVITGERGFARFSLKTKPQNASGSGGPYRILAVREDYIEGTIDIGEPVAITIEPPSTLMNIGFETVAPSDPFEVIGKMKKEITTLKGQLTRLKNGNGK